MNMPVAMKSANRSIGAQGSAGIAPSIDIGCILKCGAQLLPCAFKCGTNLGCWATCAPGAIACVAQCF